jgi:hypothetical protein
MTDYQRLLDNIRAFLASANQVRTDELADWAAEYARGCAEANDRLRRCTDYLQKGLRTEAIHAAEEQPNLLDLVAMLDLQELDAWRGVCFQYELTDPPALAIESAAALNEAYAGEETVKGLLTKHRLLALACAPVKDRLATMRKLAESDPSSPFWQEDVQSFERARLEEIRVSVPKAAKTGDSAAANRLCEDLDSKSWRTTIPADLKNRARDVAATLRGAGAQTELRKLLPALNEAYSAMSFAECRSLLDQWDTIVADSGMSTPADLQESIDPIVSWVSDQQAARDQKAAFEEACNELQRALDVDATDATLERAYLKAARMPLQMPEDLELRHQARLSARASARKNKRLLIFTAIVATFAIAAGVAAVITSQVIRGREIADVQTALHDGLQDVDAGNADRAAAMMKQLLADHSRIAGSPPIVKAAADLRSAIDAETQRASDFQKHLTAALADGVEHPKLDEIQLAEPLAKLDSEKAQLAAVKAQIEDFQNARQRDRDKKFVDEGKDLTDTIDRVLSMDLLKSDPTGYQNQLAAFQSRLGELGTYSGVSPQLLQTQIRSATALLKQKQEAIDEASLEQSLIDQLGRSASSADQASVLKMYLEKFNDSPRSVDFQRTLGEVPAEQAVEAWNLLREKWPAAMPKDLEDAASRMQQVADYLKAWPSSPFSAPLDDYASYLRMGQQMAGPDGPWKKSFRDLLNNPLVHDLQMVESQDGKCYFTLGDIKLHSSQLNGQTVSEEFDAVTSSDVSKRTHETLARTGLLKNTAPALSPQAAFAEDAERRIDQMNFVDWEQVGPQIIAELTSRTDMNPILQSILLQNALQTGQPMMDWVGEPACKAVADGLAKQGLDNLEWLDPANPPQQSVVDPLKELLRRLPPMQSVEIKLRKQRDSVLEATPGQFKVSGVIVRNGQTLSLTSEPNAASMAYVIGNSGKLVKVAQCDGHKWIVDNSTAAQVSDGALVFMSAPSK